MRDRDGTDGRRTRPSQGLGMDGCATLVGLVINLGKSDLSKLEWYV